MKTLTTILIMVALAGNAFAGSTFSASKGALLIQELSDENAMESYIAADVDAHDAFQKVSALAIQLEYDFKFDDQDTAGKTAQEIQGLIELIVAEAKTRSAVTAAVQIDRILAISYRAYAVEQLIAE